MRTSKVSKSVRLTPDQVAYIESLPGKDFTEKLSGYLDECRHGETKRKEQIKYYDNLIEKRKKEIAAFNDLAMSLRSFSDTVSYCERTFARLQAALQKTEPQN